MKKAGYRDKKTIWILSGLVFIFIAMQFFSPVVSNPPVTHPIQAPEAVIAILKRSCYDCHSNETKLSVIDKIAPLSWLVSKDVETARSRFNFSTWDTLTPAEQQGFLWEMVNMVLDNKMPLKSYLATHQESKLSEKDIAVLKQYVNGLTPAKYHDTTLIRQTAKEYDDLLTKQHVKAATPVAPNGIRYIADFRNWQVISTTNRFDNNRSIRVIYANTIAAEAARKGEINPWPQGSILIKVVWNIIEEKNGDILPGTFNNVQIMVKDNERFPDSEGWGFAKFNGLDLKPYGKNASFNATCFNCHKAASETGFVFNIPLPNGELVDINGKQ